MTGIESYQTVTTIYVSNIKSERTNFESSVLLFIGFNYDTHEVKVQNSIKIQVS